MGNFTIREVKSYTECILTEFYSESKDTFEVVLAKEFKAGMEYCQIITIEKLGIPLPQTDPIWREVKDSLEK